MNQYKSSAIRVGRACLLALVLTVSQVMGQGSKISFTHLTVENGLSQSSVLSIALDSSGFMWFGTKDGLNRFNTQTFEVFRHSPDSGSLSSSQNINALLTDSKGNLWVGTQNGLNLYLPKSNSFRRFLHDPNDKNSISNSVIRFLYQDRQGNIWVATEFGLNRLKEDFTFERFYAGKGNLQGLAHPLVKAIHQDHRNVIWVGTDNGLSSMTPTRKGYAFKTYLHDDNNPSSITQNDITTIYEDRYYNLWVGTHNKGLNLLDRISGTFKHFSQKKGQAGLNSNVIRKMKSDSDGRLWISTLNGINIYDHRTNSFTALTHNPDDPSSLNQNSVYDIVQDVAGSMWVGSYYGGVNVYHANSTPFRRYKADPGKNGISSNVISVITEDNKGNLWIGTEAEGLNHYDRQTGRFINFKSDVDNPNSLTSNLVKAVSIDRKGMVWVGTYEGALDVYSPGSGTFKHYRTAAGSGDRSLSRIVTLKHDSQGRLWVGTRAQGVFLYDESNDEFQAFTDPSLGEDLKNMRCFFEDTQQNLWISSNSGTFILPKGGGKIKRLSSRNSKFNFADVNFIYEDSKHNFWMGSYESGLIHYDAQTQQIRFFNTNDGLPSNNALGMIEDRTGAFWISTSNGLSKFHHGVFTNYTVEDGLTGNVFNYNSYFKDSKGELFFGGYNGMISFFPEQIKRNGQIPTAVFTRLRLFNKPVAIADDTKLLTSALPYTEKVTFSYDQNIFSVDFSILNYIKSEKNRYAYKLEGFDKDWNYVSTPSATFTNLPAGDYILLIRGANNDGVWTTRSERLLIKVKPPFWKTWWAYLIYVLLLSALVFLVLRFLWIRALLKREHELFQMKLDFFTNVSHEIRTPLTLIVGPLEHLVQQTRESPALNRKLLTVKRNAGRLTRLVNELMDFRKAESGNMQLSVAPSNIVSFAKEIFLSFQYIAINNQISYSFHTDEENIEVYFDSEQLEKVFFNLLSNAFKFTPKQGAIRLEICRAGFEFVEIRVSDNGRGIPEESRAKIFTNFYQVKDHRSENTGTGIGLSLAEKIAQLHNGTLYLMDKETGNDMHTCFSLKLPLGNIHFTREELEQDIVNTERPEFYRNEDDVELAINYEPEATQDGSVTVLIVEDNEEVRQFICQSLTPFYHVIAAENGQLGVEMAIERIPDIIVSDVMMPVMDGLGLCRTLKTDIRTSHIPIILLTARSGNIHQVSGLKTGAEAYITKPFSVNSLQLSIYNLLTLQANMRRKFSQQITLQPSNMLIESNDEEFLNQVMSTIEANLVNDTFTVNTLAAEVGLSTPILYKKIKTLTGLTVNNFIKSVRLKRAAQLLRQNTYTVYEVAYMVGFSESKYFSKEFAKQFGQTPSNYCTA